MTKGELEERARELGRIIERIAAIKYMDSPTLAAQAPWHVLADLECAESDLGAVAKWMLNEAARPREAETATEEEMRAHAEAVIR